MQCPNCGASVPPGTNRCVKCGGSVEQPQQQQQAQQQAAAPQVVVQVQAAPVAATPAMSSKSRIVAGLLGIFLGGLGVHRFYLGFSGIGGCMLALQIVGWVTSWLCIGIFISIGVGVWGFVEGILLLVGAMNTDAQGRPLT